MKLTFMKLSSLGAANYQTFSCLSENKQESDKYQKYKMRLTYIGIARSKYLPKQIKTNKQNKTF